MFYLQEKIETIQEEEIERRRREKDKNKTGEVAEQIKGIPQTPQPDGKVKDTSIYKVRIPLIQIKNTLHSEVLFPPKLRLHTGLRLVLVRPVMAQVLDAEIVRPPILSLKHGFKLLLPLPLESSLKDSYLYHPPIIKCSPSVIPRRQMLQLIESVTVTSNVLQPLVLNRNVMPEDTQRTEKILQDTLIEEEETFIEIMFRGEGLKRIEDGRPAVICIEDIEGESIIGVVETICKMLYREKVGGKPKAEIFSNLEEFRKEIRYIEAKNKITVIRLSENDWKNLTKEELDRFLGDRFDQLFTQDFGFIVLNTRVLRLEERHRINIIDVKPRLLSVEMKRRLAEIAWGFVKIDEKYESMDEIFEDGRGKFENALERIQRQNKGIFVDATKPHKAGESNEHLWMKWFLVKCGVEHLIDKGELPKNPTLTQIKNKVETEVVDSNRFPDAVPDVVVGNMVFEVETLFSEDGEGKIARNKLTYTIDKYNSSTNINIVLDNITFLRHLKMLRQILGNYEKDGKKNINFWTLDLKNGKLISLEKILKIIREFNPTS